MGNYKLLSTSEVKVIDNVYRKSMLLICVWMCLSTRAFVYICIISYSNRKQNIKLIDGISGFWVQNNHIKPLPPECFISYHAANMPLQILYISSDTPQINLSFPRNALGRVCTANGTYHILP